MDKLDQILSMRNLIFSGLIFFLVLSTTVIARENCRFIAPDSWNQTQTHWEGKCSAGYAEGLGVLKEFKDLKNYKIKRFFFGRIEHGDITIGVIDQKDGYTAGKFRQGRFMPSDERQDTIDAFRQAELAAQQIAHQFRKAGNAKSARFYQAKARVLREQMD